MLQLATPISQELPRTRLAITGAHGLGDNLHQRACVKQLMLKHEVYLYTSWVSVYHDLIADGLHVLNRPTSLRTQRKNAQREAALFEKSIPGGTLARIIELPYRPERVRALGTVLAAMCEAWRCDYAKADFRMPVPLEWIGRLESKLKCCELLKPLLVYRPLTIRPEWRGAERRNPDFGAYAELFRTIRERFFVVSVADIENGKEWIVGSHPADIDARFEKGELTFEELAALFSVAKMVFTSPGFPVVLAQAVSTPVFALFGGYEDHRSFLGGARYSPYLGIDPINPCQCFSHGHHCKKQVDLETAKMRLLQFVEAHA